MGRMGGVPAPPFPYSLVMAWIDPMETAAATSLRSETLERDPRSITA